MGVGTPEPLVYPEEMDSFGFDDEDAKIVLKTSTLDPRPPYTPPKRMSPEELRVLVQRAREVGPLLAAKLDEYNSSLARAEEVFEEKLGLEATGRVVLKPRVHLVFRKGEFLVERLQGSRPPNVRSLFDESKEVRLLAGGALKELFRLCGGQLPSTTSAESPR
jgi:hypothetical protein